MPPNGGSHVTLRLLKRARVATDIRRSPSGVKAIVTVQPPSSPHLHCRPWQLFRITTKSLLFFLGQTFPHHPPLEEQTLLFSAAKRRCIPDKYGLPGLDSSAGIS